MQIAGVHGEWCASICLLVSPVLYGLQQIERPIIGRLWGISLLPRLFVCTHVWFSFVCLFYIASYLSNVAYCSSLLVSIHFVWSNIILLKLARSLINLIKTMAESAESDFNRNRNLFKNMTESETDSCDAFPYAQSCKRVPQGRNESQEGTNRPGADFWRSRENVNDRTMALCL